MPLVECRLAKIVRRESHDGQVVVLEEVGGSRRFPIIIGIFEVFAIQRFVNDERPPRPFTHELIGNICRALNVSIEKIVINELRDRTFYARLVLKQDGKLYDVDSRPSDAIALAAMTGARIFVEEEVIKAASQDFG